MPVCVSPLPYLFTQWAMGRGDWDHYDGQLGNISLDQNNNIIANAAFKNYLETLNDLLKFEIKRFL